MCVLEWLALVSVSPQQNGDYEGYEDYVNKILNYPYGKTITEAGLFIKSKQKVQCP